MKNIIFILLFFLNISQIFAQKIEYRTYFVEDSVKIGDSISLVSILKYPNNIELIQPDSTFNYSSLDFIGKKTFPSIKIDNLIVDSTIYYLRTFEIDTIQNVYLEATIVNSKDSLKISSNNNSIALITQVNDLSLKSIENTLFSRIKSIFNSEKAAYIIAGVLSLILLSFLLFRKKIIKYFKIRRIKKLIIKFNNEFKFLSKNYSKNNHTKELEQLLLLWKRFMEKFTKKPYASSTTNEISVFAKDKKIIQILSASDKSIYSEDNTPIELEKLNTLKLKATIIAENEITNIKNE